MYSKTISGQLHYFSVSFQLYAIEFEYLTNKVYKMKSQKSVKVWDLPLRIFHWLLVAGFFYD